MSKCPHDLSERETACADGYCPLCLAAELDEARAVRDVRDLCAKLRNEARVHAQEARTANATIAKIYRACTGGTGEPGNWRGAQPVIDTLARLTRELDEARRTIAKWDELHRVIAEELGTDAETWPDHRNAPLAIAAAFVRTKMRAERAEAECERLRALLAEAAEREQRYVLPLYRDENYAARIRAALAAARGEGK